MKTLYKKLGIASALLFLISIVGVAYTVYNTSANVASALQIREVKELSLLEQVVKNTGIAVGIEVTLGVLAVLFLLLGSQSASMQAANNIGADLSNNKNIYNHSDTENTQANKKRLEIVEEKLKASYADNNTKLDKVLASICNELEACQGAIFQVKQTENKQVLEMCASYAYFFAESKTLTYEFGEGLTGQVAKEGKLLNISSIPEGYVTIISGLGKSSPKNLIIVPIVSYVSTIGVIEIASFKPFTKEDEAFLKELSPMLEEVLPIHQQVETTA